MIPFQKASGIYSSDVINVDFMDTWREMEAAVDSGVVRDIGISNFNQQQIERLMSTARRPPAMLQVV